MKFESLSAAAEATDLIVNNQKQSLYVFFLFFCPQQGRWIVHKKRRWDFSLLWIPQMPRLSIGITRAIFHIYLSVTHRPLTRQQASKTKKAFCCWVILSVCVRRLANHLSRRPGGWQERARWKCYKKNTGGKNQPTQKRGGGGQRLVHEVTICQWGEKFNGEIYIDLFSTACMNAPCGLTAVWQSEGRQWWT